MKRFLFLRRVVGKSMTPRLAPGELVLAAPLKGRPRVGQVVIVEQNGKEKIKRVERVDPDKGQLYVIGDNLKYSSDSRHFGWLPNDAILGRVVWPRRHN